MDSPPLISVEEADKRDSEFAESNRARQASGSRRHQMTAKDGACFRVPGPLPYIQVDAPSSHHTLGRGRNYHY